jgi:hypothetical protein
MAKISSHSEFPRAYTPLADTGEIRLLILQPRTTSGGTIECTLVNVKLSEDPQYEALSYMWSPKHLEDTTGDIKLDGEVHEVNENLLDALHSLRYRNKPRVVWIDALCINQKDISERTLQVKQMSSIYSSAKCVIVWLGQTLRARDGTEQPGDPLTTIRRFNSRISKIHDVPPTGDEISAVWRLCSNEYWKRLWIIQEVLVASEIKVYDGNVAIEWDTLSRVVNHAKLKVDTELGVDWRVHRRIQSRIWDSQIASFCEDRQAQPPKLSPIVDLCFKYSGSLCRRPRDKIFGLHALGKPCCKESSPVDYSVNYTTLLGSVLWHYITEHLYASASVATIVVSEAQYFHEILCADLDDCFDLPVHNSSVSLQPRGRDIYSTSQIPSLITATGAARGRITHVWAMSVEVPSLETSSFWLSTVSNDIRTQLHFLMAHRERKFPYEKLVYMTNKIDLIDSVPDIAYEDEIPQPLNAPSSFVKQAWPPPREPSSSALRQLLLDAKYAAQKASREDCNIAFEENGLICFAPKGTRVGDILCQFQGSNVIALVRNTSSDGNGCPVVRGRCVNVLATSINELFEIGGGSRKALPQESRVELRMDIAVLQMLTRASSRIDVDFLLERRAGRRF